MDPSPKPQPLTALEPRPIADVANMAIAVQANLVQLKVAQSKRLGVDSARHDIRVPAPGAITAYRDALIPRQVIATYDDTALDLRIHEVWGQFCLLCWFFQVDDPQHPPDFRNLLAVPDVRCPTALLTKTQELERSLWRLRFEQRFRSDPDFRKNPNFDELYRTALDIPVMVMGRNVRVCAEDQLILGSCEFAGMLGAARWIGDSRWQWAQAGIMDLPGDSRLPGAK